MTLTPITCFFIFLHADYADPADFSSHTEVIYNFPQKSRKSQKGLRPAMRHDCSLADSGLMITVRRTALFFETKVCMIVRNGRARSQSV
jgi:hypothetical protein